MQQYAHTLRNNKYCISECDTQVDKMKLLSVDLFQNMYLYLLGVGGRRKSTLGLLPHHGSSQLIYQKFSLTSLDFHCININISTLHLKPLDINVTEKSLTSCIYWQHRF